MIGAIIGDIAGSKYEFRNIKSRDFDFFIEKSSGKKSFFTDDTVLTVAIANIVLDNDFSEENIIKRLKEWSLKYRDKGYGLSFMQQWVLNPNPKPYNSMGNGSAMRISPIALYYDDWEEIQDKTIKCTQITHNHPEGIKGALATSRCIYLAKQKKSKEEIKMNISTLYGYNLNRKLDEIQPAYSFDATCPKSVPESIICFLESYDYESTIRNCIYLGGDCDTTSAIAGSIAEAYYGINDEILKEIFKNDILTDEIKEIIVKFYKKK